MRLDFNYVIIDDDFGDVDDRQQIDELIVEINRVVKEKGFIPKEKTFDSKDSFNQYFQRPSGNEPLPKNRIDLYLSDNNMGEDEHENDGINIYLDLRTELRCDFVLYTRSSTDEIVNKLTEELNEKKDPSMFSRFTFVSRSSDSQNWQAKVIDLLDVILTKREEINNLRGLYAEKVSKIDLHLKETFNRPDKEDLIDTIDNIPNQHFNQAYTKQYIHRVRQIRNGLLHNDEEFCSRKKEYCLTYEENKKKRKIYESDLKKFRDWINSAYDFVIQIEKQ